MGAKFHCKECGLFLPLHLESSVPDVCRSCQNWLETINAGEGRSVSWELEYYRERFPELTLNRPTLDWLRQNY
jgi:hypothetical protein